MKRILFFIALLIVISLPTVLDAATTGVTRYAGPGGAGTLCTEFSPCALSRINTSTTQAGDTWILMSGTYQPASQNVLTINCAAGPANGTATNPVTIQAQSQYLAYINPNAGYEGILHQNCAHWHFIGLRVGYNSGASDSSSRPNNGLPMWVINSPDTVIRNSVFHRCNRYTQCTGLVLLQNSPRAIVEDNQITRFSFEGLKVTVDATGTELRRNYINPYDFALASGGCVAGVHHWCGYVAGISTYNSGASVGLWVENNIIEGNALTVQESAAGDVRDNKYLGNIGLNSLGFLSEARGTNPTVNTLVRDHIQVTGSTGQYGGMRFNATRNTIVENATLIYAGGTSTAGFIADNGGYSVSNTSITFRNIIVTGGYSVGFSTVPGHWTTFTHSHLTSFSNSDNWEPNTLFAGTNNETDPALGSCVVYIPASSPMTASGNGGANRGATVLKQYLRGSLTSEDLWDWSLTGADRGKWKKAGPVVSGATDELIGLHNVHQRLGFGTGLCPNPFEQALTALASVEKVPARFPITVSVTNGTGGTNDWVGIHPVGAIGSGHVAWQYLNGTQTPPASPILNTTLTFAAPSTPGDYEFRFYRNDSIQPGDLMATTSFHDFVGRLMVGAGKSLKIAPTKSIKVQGGS